MANEIEIITASFQGNGLFHEGKSCVYIISFNGENDKYYYVGKTGTSNRTGTNSPFKRLATHLMAKGKTQSCIFSKDENESEEMKSGLKPEHYRNMKFTAIYFENKKDAISAEQLLCNAMKKVFDKKLINQNNCNKTPLISEDVNEKIVALLNAARLKKVICKIANA